jgi:signal transduction histidine kinase
MFRRMQPIQVIVDVVIAVAVLGFALYADRDDPTGVLSLGLAIAVGFRRFSPGIALAVAWLAALFQMYVISLNPSYADLAILAVIYATAAYGTRTVRWLGFASIFVGAVLGAAFIEYGGHDFVLSLHLSSASFAEVARFVVTLALYGALLLVILGLPWTAGNLVRTRIIARQSREAQQLAEIDAEGAERDVIVEQERNRIARDMHDVVAHSLAVVIAQSDGARYAQKFDPGAVDEALMAISTTAREALADVRLLLGQLRHSQSEGPQPALADLGRLLDQLRASGLVIGFDASGIPLPLGTGQQLAIYRIVQEALTNALRHGDPEHETFVHFLWTADDLEVTITSTLVSSPGTSELRVGHGLAGMRERAALVGGHLTTEVGEREFTVRAVIPASAMAQK